MIDLRLYDEDLSISLYDEDLSMNKDSNDITITIAMETCDICFYR